MERVLLIRFSSLGDLVLLTPIIELLNRCSYEVHLATHSKFADLFSEDDRIGKLILYKGELKPFLRNLREEKYRLVVDLHKKALSILTLLLSRGEKKKSYSKRIIARRIAVHFKKKIREVHVTQLYAKPILETLGIEGELPAPSLKFKKRPIIEIKDYALLFPGAKHRTKIWPHFGKLAKLISNKLQIPVVIGGDRNDIEVAGEVEREAKVLNMVGKTDINGLLNLIDGSAFVVSNDSGPAHIAAALKKPLFVFFGPTIREFGFRPIGGSVKLFEVDLPCRPCSLHGEKPCKRGDLACLHLITPEVVFDEIRRTLS